MRTLHVGLRVQDLDHSLEFYSRLGYDVVGTVPATQLGSLTMLKLPSDPFVSLELVHDPNVGTVIPGGLNHLVIQVDAVHDAALAWPPSASTPTSPPRRAARRTSGPRGSPIPTATGSSSSSGPQVMPRG